jgi:glycyl-tRNA synthetase alpha subunit
MFKLTVEKYSPVVATETYPDLAAARAAASAYQRQGYVTRITDMSGRAVYG